MTTTITRKPARLRAGVVLLGIVVGGSVLGHFLLPDPNQQDLLSPLKEPSLAHLFGTDDLGRDVLSRTLAATWLDLPFAILVTYVSVALGLVVGTVAGFSSKPVERVIMRLVDTVIAFPYLVFVLAVVAIMGPGVPALAVGAVGASWAFYARLTRGETLVLRERQFIQAARTLGFSRSRVMLRHAAPNLLRPVVVYSFSDVVFNLMAMAGLSFLGVGVAPPTPEWGAIIESGQQYLLSAWWISVLPGFVVIVVGLGFVLIGDALGERLGVHRGR